MRKIALSYRRADSAGTAGRIFDELGRRFGQDEVFMDIDAIPIGVDFRKYVVQALENAAVLVVIIGPRWLGTRKHGQYRIMDEEDPVRLELEAAIRLGLPIVPVLVEGATMPKATDLPESLRDVPYLNAAQVDAGRDFRAHVSRLCASLEKLAADAAAPAQSAAAPEPVKPLAAVAVAPPSVPVEPELPAQPAMAEPSTAADVATTTFAQPSLGEGHVAETAVEPTRVTFRRPWAAAVDRAIGMVVEPVAALLVVAEVVILSAGVFTRYVLGNPLVWSDELATLVFLWLAMLGSVVAYRRGEHISLSALVRRASPRTRQILETISSVVATIFVIELMPATLKFFKQQQIDLTPALQIPRSYEVLAVMIALSLILILALLRLSEQDPKIVAGVVVAAVAISGVMWFERAAFVGLGNFNLVLFFVVLVGVCVAMGVPIAFSFGLGTLSYILIVTSVGPDIVVQRMQEGVSNLVLLAVPLFIFLGLLMETAGIAQRLVGALASLVGHLRGGLSIVLVGAMYLVSGISGSKIADMAAVAPVLFPDMERRGQKRTSMIALLATSGAMAETIPPSLVLIIIGSVTGVSIQAMFTAGLLPAFLLSIFLVAVALWDAKRENATLSKRAPMKVVAWAFFIAIPGLVLPLVIRYFVVAGIATATEVSVVGIIYTLLVGVLVYRALDWRTLYPTLIETVSLAGAILLIIATATAMGWALTQSGFAQQLADILGHAPGGKAGIMLLSIVMFIFLGSVLEGIPAMVLFGPLLFPVAKAAGINEVHYAIVVVLAMGVGLFSPPVGIGFFAASAIGKANPEQVVKPLLPYMLALLIGLLIVAYVPWISLGFLPKLQGQ